MANGMGAERTFVIAEAGVNHNGSLDLALQLVDAAKQAGAAAVKFQAFRAERLAAPSAPKAAYQKVALARGNGVEAQDETQFAMLKTLELAAADFAQIRDHCESVGIEFLASPFDEEAVTMLAHLGVRLLKVPSGEITNLPLLRHIGATGLPVILSTGMSWLAEVEAAVTTLQGAGCDDVTLLHCVTEYPAPPEQINLRAMATLRAAFGLPVGYSDHTPGIEIAVAATALGASVIEKHLTLDRALPGPDHSASLEPAEFGQMVAAIRNVERSLGDGRKRPAPVEVPNMVVARKSLVSSRSRKAGELLEPGDVVIRRPGSGIPPEHLDHVVGRRLALDLEAGQVINWEHLA